MFAEFQIEEDADKQRGNEDDDEQFIIEKDWKPSVALRRNDVGITRESPINPNGNKTRGDVVHHEGEKRFVRVEERFENGWDGSPYRTSGNRSDTLNQNDRYVRHIAAKLNHHDEADQSADGDLAVSTKVPEFHFESWDESKTNSKEKGAIS